MVENICIAISTAGARINSLILPAKCEYVTYLIIHQVRSLSDKDIWLESNSRDDVCYVLLTEFGLSRSRNCIFERCNSKYAYIMDDDVFFDLNKIKEVIRRMDLDQVDVATCQFQYQNGKFPKLYRQEEFSHNILSAAKVASIEICVNVAVLNKHNIRFDERFGLGTDLPSGEEYVFLVDCLKSGLKVKYYPIVVGTHPNETSGMDFYTSASKILAKREMLKRVFGWSSAFFILAFWMKKVRTAFRAGHSLKFTKIILFGVK